MELGEKRAFHMHIYACMLVFVAQNYDVIIQEIKSGKLHRKYNDIIHTQTVTIDAHLILRVIEAGKNRLENIHASSSPTSMQ